MTFSPVAPTWYVSRYPVTLLSRIPARKNGSSASTSRRGTRPFFHQRISKTAAGNDAVTVLLSRAQRKSVSANAYARRSRDGKK